MDRLIAKHETSDSIRLSPKLRIPNMSAYNHTLRDEVKLNSALRLGSQLRGKINWDDFGPGSAPMAPFEYERLVQRLKAFNGMSNGDLGPSLNASAYHAAFQDGRVREFAKVFKNSVGVPFETVLADGVSYAWIMGPGVYPDRLVQMHRVAAEILPHKGEIAPYDIPNFDGSPTPKDAVWIPEDAMRKVMRQMYDNTQKDLAERGVDEVTLVRGVRLPGRGPDQMPHVSDVRLRPLSSYATRFESTAQFWAKGTTGVDHAAIVVTKVPRKYVFSTPYQGAASWDESEVTVLGGTHRSTVYEFSTKVLPSNIMHWEDTVDSTLDT